MRSSTLFFSLAIAVTLTTSSDGQEIRNTIRDYHTDRPVTYSPADPWARGAVFNTHTGHSGFFYNCDGEECKRNSPYICWKTHHEPDLPPRRGFWCGLIADLAEVRQRIDDGACGHEGGTYARDGSPFQTVEHGSQFENLPNETTQTERINHDGSRSATTTQAGSVRHASIQDGSLHHAANSKFGLIAGSTVSDK